MYLLCCRLINDTQVESEEEKHREIWKRAGKNMYIQKKEKKKKVGCEKPKVGRGLSKPKATKEFLVQCPRAGQGWSLAAAGKAAAGGCCLNVPTPLLFGRGGVAFRGVARSTSTQNRVKICPDFFFPHLLVIHQNVFSLAKKLFL